MSVACAAGCHARYNVDPSVPRVVWSCARTARPTTTRRVHDHATTVTVRKASSLSPTRTAETKCYGAGANHGLKDVMASRT
eukprot:11166743-Karenia_brevis.AAC.1